MPTTYQFVSPEYFPLVGIPIVHGRGFLPAEAQAEALVGIVNRSGARALWGDADPIGQTVWVRFVERGPGDETKKELRAVGGPDDPPAGTTPVIIVGVARDMVSTFVYTGKDASHLYLPTNPSGSRAESMLVRGRTAADLRVDRAQALLREAHDNPLAFEVIPLEEMLAMQLYPLKMASWIGSLLGVIALGLSVSGLYGVLTYTLSQRVREIGIRMSLGATAAAVVRLIVTQSARLTVVGALVGLVSVFSVMKVLSSLVRLQNVTVLDAGAFGIAVAVVCGAAVLAAYAPARRAARIDPAETLRAE